ncbi:MAG: PilZ domain-containing protein, partial [Candidatus Methylomirabilales bacterium]
LVEEVEGRMDGPRWRSWPLEEANGVPDYPGVLVLADRAQRILYIAAAQDLRATLGPDGERARGALAHDQRLPRGAREAAAFVHWEEAPDPVPRRAALLEAYTDATEGSYPPFNRRHRRYPTCHPTSCDIAHGSSVLHLEGETVDFSEGGVGVLVSSPIPPETPVTVQIHTPTGPLEGLGLVLWSAPQGKRTRLGIEIYTPLGFGGRVRWARHLESLAARA